MARQSGLDRREVPALSPRPFRGSAHQLPPVPRSRSAWVKFDEDKPLAKQEAIGSDRPIHPFMLLPQIAI